MSGGVTCVALLCGDIHHRAVESWLSADDFEEHLLHVEPLCNVSPVGGSLTADPFAIPEGIDPRAITGLALIDCETGEVSRYGFQLPALGVSCLKGQNVLCLRGWCDEAPTVQEYESDCAHLLDDPCALYRELQCCWLRLVKEQEKVSVAFRDRRVQFAPRSEADKGRLFQMLQEAKSECEGCASDYRGGSLGHSCRVTAYRRRRGGCC